MSSDKFDEKIKDKLQRFRPEYQTEAWDSFKKHLPVPWYMHFFRDYGGWLFSGLMFTALAYTLWDNSNQTKRLNDQISILSNQVENRIEKDTVTVNKYFTDTVYVKQFVNRYVPLPRQERLNNMAAKSELLAKSGASPFISESELQEFKVWKEQKTTMALNESESALPTKSDAKEGSKVEDASKEDLQKIDPLKLLAKATAEEQIPEVKEIPKKKINLPNMRAGISSDYMGLDIFTTGPAFEVFLMDKLSVNTGILFSGQIETKHPQEKDFNNITGKVFADQYPNEFVANSSYPVQVEDISIKTSLVKMPVYFNYYINTWSRFSFLVSAGTKLDLSVYQNVDYLTGVSGNQTKNRFEARPKPAVFNNLFYGLGLQYQYGKVAALLTPYFDFTIRETNYFNPPKNFGINGSLRFQFVK